MTAIRRNFADGVPTRDLGGSASTTEAIVARL